MEQKDRRTGSERRTNERYNVSLDIEWSSDGGMQPGRLNDVSKTGCFVLTGGEFTEGEVVKVYFPLTDGKRIEFLSAVINHVKDVGFGVRFMGLTDTQEQFLQNFAELHQSDLKAANG